MGTVMNGNVWVGACVNGKVVSGLTKNGVVFYRKPVSTYKRRIMVGDSLGGKDIYNDFPTGYYSTFQTGTNSFTTLVESNGAPLIYENVINSPQDIEISSDEMVSGYSPYHYVDGEETISEKMTIDDYDTFDVTNITDNASYRHLFIEDESIRPIKVGDIITSETKLYFTFPDDFANNNDTQMIYILTANSSDDSVNAYLWYTEMTGLVPPHVYFNFNGITGYNMEDIYVIDSSNEVLKNISSVNLKLTKPIIVDHIDGSQEAKNVINHILVDTTTLGA